MQHIKSELNLRMKQVRKSSGSVLSWQQSGYWQKNTEITKWHIQISVLKFWIINEMRNISFTRYCLRFFRASIAPHNCYVKQSFLGCAFPCLATVMNDPVRQTLQNLGWCRIIDLRLEYKHLFKNGWCTTWLDWSWEACTEHTYSDPLQCHLASVG